jgi:hypothetical protein
MKFYNTLFLKKCVNKMLLKGRSFARKERWSYRKFWWRHTHIRHKEMELVVKKKTSWEKNYINQTYACVYSRNRNNSAHSLVHKKNECPACTVTADRPTLRTLKIIVAKCKKIYSSWLETDFISLAGKRGFFIQKREVLRTSFNKEMNFIDNFFLNLV